MIDKLTVDRIYAAANIVEVVEDFIALKKKGVNYQALCPFHNEKTPSFVVSPSKGLFKCFGCGKGGNAVTFVMEHEGMSYPDALRYVAKKYNIEVQSRELTPEQMQENDDRESMLVVSSYAAKWFSDQLLNGEEGQNVGLSYFRERGFSNSTISKFGLGYCPAYNNEFTKSAVEAGYKEEFLVSSGLSGESSRDGALYDRFYGRVIFPIHSVSGRVIAFGGRTLKTDKKSAKYLNSPESKIYSKSKVLYGLFYAKRAMMQEDACILVEGYTDVISMVQSGVENVVATSGTALTTDQVRLIKRFTRNVTVLFDGDQAGVKASLRGIDIILREGMNVRVVSLPKDEDPDSFARSHSGTEVKEFIESNIEDFISFKTRVLLEGAEDDPIQKAELIGDIVASIAEVPDPIMRSLYIKETAETMDMSREILASEVARKRISHGADRETREFIRRQGEERRKEQRAQSDMVQLHGVSAGSSMEELEKELMKYLLKYGDHNFDYKEGDNIVSLNVSEIIINDLEANGLTFANPQCRALYERYVELFNEKKELLKGASSGNTAQSEESEEGENATLSVEMYHFTNHADPMACNLAVDLLTDNDNYVISKMWQKYDIVVEGEADRLAEIVPRTVILYKSKAIETIIESLQKKLTDSELSESETSDVIFQIATLNQERMSIANKLSRLIL